jgi:hypothetical protein
VDKFVDSLCFGFGHRIVALIVPKDRKSSLPLVNILKFKDNFITDRPCCCHHAARKPLDAEGFRAVDN